MLQQQQEELERIRQQQLQEQEKERERQRIEAEKQEEERLRAAHSNHHNTQNSNQSGQNRQRRPVTATVVKGKGVVGASRIPARPNTANTTGPSRVGPGGAVRKLGGKLVMKRVIDRLPLRYREEVRERSKIALLDEGIILDAVTKMSALFILAISRTYRGNHAVAIRAC
jgi:hypothetical protein